MRLSTTVTLWITCPHMCYLLSKVNIWNVDCARATTFIFDARTDVLVKVSKLLRKKMSRPEGESRGIIDNGNILKHMSSHVLYIYTACIRILIFQVFSNAESVSVSWRQHDLSICNVGWSMMMYEDMWLPNGQKVMERTDANKIIWWQMTGLR